MGWRLWLAVLSLMAFMFPRAVSSAQTAPTPRPEGTLTVAVATFGNERWYYQSCIPGLRTWCSSP